MRKKLVRRMFEKETKETLWSFATKIVAAIFFIILNAYLARMLGTEMWGKWSFLLSLLTIVSLISFFGLNNAARAYAARYNQTAELSAVLRDSLVLRIAISAVFTTLFLVSTRPLAGVVRHPELAEVLPYAAPIIFLMGFSEYLKQIFTGVHRLKYHLIVNTFEFGGKIVFAVLLLSWAVTLENVLISQWIALGISVIIGFVYWYRFFRSSSGNVGGNYIRDIFRYSLPLFFISIGFLMLTEIDTLMLGILSTDYEVGQFAIGKQIANKLPQIALALSMGTMPGFARLTKENLPQMRQKFNNILRLNALVFLPGGVLTVLLAPWVVPFIFGEEYRPSVLPLQILTLWFVLTSFNMFLNALLDYQGRAVRRAVNFVITMAFTIGLNLYLIPRYGAVGAAISTTVAYTPFFLLNWLEVRKVFAEI